jgi:hypothetical protein
VFSALLDTCVLVPSLLRDVLLETAEQGVYRALWSAEILHELEYTLRDLFERDDREPDEIDAAIHRLLGHMGRAFPDALIEDWEDLEDAFDLPDRNDRHVVAAAVKGRADAVVTDNLKDFPPDRMPNGLLVQSADDFLLDALDLAPDAVMSALMTVAERTGRTGPKLSPLDIANAVERCSTVGFAAAMRRRLTAAT